MAKEKSIEVFGTVLESKPSMKFVVQLANGHKVLAHLCGKIQMHFIKVVPGDTVTVELSPYDLNRGRIIFRGKKKEQEENPNRGGKRGN